MNDKFITPITIKYYTTRFFRRNIGFAVSDIITEFREKHNLQNLLCTLERIKTKYIIDDGFCDFEIYIGNRLVKSLSENIIDNIDNVFTFFQNVIQENENEILNIYEQNIKTCEILEQEHDYKSLFFFYKGFDKVKQKYYLKKILKKDKNFEKEFKKLFN